MFESLAEVEEISQLILSTKKIVFYFLHDKIFLKEFDFRDFF